MPPIETMPPKGTYTLILLLPKEIRLNIGKLGLQKFPRGYYAYTGSALGTGASSLKRRNARHLQKGKRKFWHIDFLLAHENVVVTAVVAGQTNRKMECEINKCIKLELGAEVAVAGFGASDCKKNCESHLSYFGEENVKEKVAKLYTRKLESKPTVINV